MFLYTLTTLRHFVLIYRMLGGVGKRVGSVGREL